MTAHLTECRKFAERCRELAAEAPIPETQDHIELAVMLECMVAEIESGDALLSTLEEVIRALPTQLEGVARKRH